MSYVGKKFPNIAVNAMSEMGDTFKLNILPEISWIDMFGTYANYNEKELSLTMKPFEYLWLKL